MNCLLYIKDIVTVVKFCQSMDICMYNRYVHDHYYYVYLIGINDADRAALTLITGCKEIQTDVTHTVESANVIVVRHHDCAELGVFDELLLHRFSPYEF